MKYLLYFFIFSFIFLFGCKNENPSLPSSEIKTVKIVTPGFSRVEIYSGEEKKITEDTINKIFNNYSDEERKQAVQQVMAEHSLIFGVRNNYNVDKNIAVVEKYEKTIDLWCHHYNISQKAAKAIFILENGGGVNLVSPSGCVGIGQLNRQVALNLGLKIDDYTDERYIPEKNIKTSIRLMAELHKAYPGRWDLVMAAYHMGQPNLDNIISSYSKSLYSKEFTNDGDYQEGLVMYDINFVKLCNYRISHNMMIRLRDSSSTYLWRALASFNAYYASNKNKELYKDLKYRYNLPLEFQWYWNGRVFKDISEVKDGIKKGLLVYLPDSFIKNGIVKKVIPKDKENKEFYPVAYPETIGLLYSISKEYKKSTDAILPLRNLLYISSEEQVNTNSMGVAFDLSAEPSCMKKEEFETIKAILVKYEKDGKIYFFYNKKNRFFHICIHPYYAEKYIDIYNSFIEKQKNS